jgi:hypothetical protein
MKYFLIIFLLAVSSNYLISNNKINIYANDSLVIEEIIISNIKIKGNKKTKKEIILRELDFKVGEKISINKLKVKIYDAKENLTNLNLFNFIEFEYKEIENNVSIQVKLTERWYVWPYPIFEISDRNFNVWWHDFKQSNYSDLTRINYGLFINIENFRGRNELIILKYRRGFKEHYQLNYKVPFLKKNQNLGINTDIEFFRRKKTFYKTQGDSLLFFEDKENFTSKDLIVHFDVIFRNNIKILNKLKAKYFLTNINDSINILNPNYLSNNSNKASYLRFSYNFIYENRNNKNYPLEGNYINIEASKSVGLSSPINHLELNSHLEYHHKIKETFFIGSSFRSRITYKNLQSYFTNETFGFNDYVRGYEYYVVDGKDYWLSKSSIKTCLIKPKKFTIPYFKMEQFRKSHYSVYLSVFSDLGYARNIQNFNENLLTNSIMWGRGVSLDYVTYYNKMIRLEFTINSLSEKGVFLHFSNPFGTNK